MSPFNLLSSFFFLRPFGRFDPIGSSMCVSILTSVYRNYTTSTIFCSFHNVFRHERRQEKIPLSASLPLHNLLPNPLLSTTHVQV
mmetsp:Transcript_49946/g.97744  ORF Transcript_49946/g.97744 Transcript_49946/m.97744 type:complete len:85 (+) Transcript_49946:160-414(+)